MEEEQLTTLLIYDIIFMTDRFLGLFVGFYLPNG